MQCLQAIFDGLEPGGEPRKRLTKVLSNATLCWAVRERRSDGAKAALQLGADANLTNEGQILVTTAIQNGDVKTLEVLITAGADVNRRNMEKETPLTMATRNGHVVAIELLIK